MSPHLSCVLVLDLGADVRVQGEVGTKILKVLCGGTGAVSHGRSDTDDS